MKKTASELDYIFNLMLDYYRETFQSEDRELMERVANQLILEQKEAAILGRIQGLDAGSLKYILNKIRTPKPEISLKVETDVKKSQNSKKKQKK